MAIGMCSTEDRRGTHIHCNAILQTDYFVELLCAVKQSGTAGVKSSSSSNSTAAANNSSTAVVKSSSSTSAANNSSTAVVKSSSSEQQWQQHSSREVQQANMTAVIAPESRIINIQLLSRHIEDVTQHVATCSACHMVAQSSDVLTIFGEKDRK